MDIIIDFLIDHPELAYPSVFFILLGCGMGVPIPEDITLFAAGLASYYGICDVWTMIGVALAGVLIGDSFIFWLGRKFGRRLMNKRPFRYFLDETKIEAIKKRLHNHGGKLLFSARFMPGLRSTIFFSSGMLHFPYRKLLMYDGGAALISVPAIVFSVFYFGDILEKVIHWIKKVEGGIVGAIVLVIAFIVFRWWWKKRKAAARTKEEVANEL
ncbi:MAG: DedA family protein [Bdellovibrionales bacterium]|nr:DedA family protein [Bdellovibrionales bacterium]